MYVCTYQQIQDMLSLQCDCSVVTDQEESQCTNKEIDVYQSVCMYNYDCIIIHDTCTCILFYIPVKSYFKDADLWYNCS